MSEEAITCIAVKIDRHQNIMSSVALKKGVERPWTSERVAKFIDLLGYLEITLKSGTEPAIIAFGNRVAAVCKAEVTTEYAVNGDKESHGLIENAVMADPWEACEPSSATLRAICKSHNDSPMLPWLVEHARFILSRCQKGRDGKTPFERLHGKKADARICPVWRESAGKTSLHRSR